MKQQFSVITLNETWLTETNSEYVNTFTNHEFINLNRANKKGGGIGIFISNKVNYKLSADLYINEEGIIESLLIEINTKTKKP